MPDFQSAEDLATRIANAVIYTHRKVIFLLGSGIVLPSSDGQGIPGARQVVQLIREKYGPDFADCNTYQEAFDRLVKKIGQEAANHFIQQLVIRARKDSALLGRDTLFTNEEVEKLERDIPKWYTPLGLRALSALIGHFPDIYGKTVLTTNFDPLIEIALSKHKTPWYSTALDKDGSLLYVRGTGPHVVHIHGKWGGSDTLHTPAQLTQARSRLKASLRTLMGGATLVVLGFGGWDDIIRVTIREMLEEAAAPLDVLWGFYEPDESKILRYQSHITDLLAPAVDRASFYKGVFVDEVLPLAFEKAIALKPAQDIAILNEKIFLAKSGAIDYSGLAEPWSKPGLSISYFLQDVAKMSKEIAIRMVLYGLEYILPTLEHQAPHQAPVDSPYKYVRDAMNNGHELIRKGRENNETAYDLVRQAINYIPDDQRGHEAVTRNITVHFIAAHSAFEALLAFLEPDLGWGSYDFHSLIGKAIHAISRAVHDDDGGLWAYIIRRIDGGPNNLGRFNP